MTIREIETLDRLDRMDRKMLEIFGDSTRSPKQKWLRLLESIHDDAFDVDPFILQDFLGAGGGGFAAYYELPEEEQGSGYSPGSIPWWPNNLYYILYRNPYWKGTFPHKKKDYKRAYSKSPLEKKVPIRETSRQLQSRIAANDDQTVMELLLTGAL
jgi:hypothetical protein